MTNDSDSLSAALGGLEFLRKAIIPGGLVGWEGPALCSETLDLVRGDGEVRRHDVKMDLVVEYMGVDGHTLHLRGIVIRLEIRNLPFNDGYVVGSSCEILAGMLQEGKVLHKNTLPEGVFDFVVVERLI